MSSLENAASWGAAWMQMRSVSGSLLRLARIALNVHQMRSSADCACLFIEMLRMMPTVSLKTSFQRLILSWAEPSISPFCCNRFSSTCVNAGCLGIQFGNLKLPCLGFAFELKEQMSGLWSESEFGNLVEKSSLGRNGGTTAAMMACMSQAEVVSAEVYMRSNLAITMSGLWCAGSALGVAGQLAGCALLLGLACREACQVNSLCRNSVKSRSHGSNALRR